MGWFFMYFFSSRVNVVLNGVRFVHSTEMEKKTIRIFYVFIKRLIIEMIKTYSYKINRDKSNALSNSDMINCESVSDRFFF